MQTQVKKHFTLQIVLPPVIFLAAAALLGYFRAADSMLLAAVAAFIFIWLWMAMRAYNAYTGSINLLMDDLKQLENGETPATADPGAFRNWYLGSLQRTAALIQKQENALQQEKLRRLRSMIDGQDQERNRLSRELHDSVGQSLIAVKLQLEHAETLNYSQMRAGIDMAKNMTDQTIEEVRRVCNDLLPASLNEFGLETALRARCNEMGALGGFKVVFETEGSLERIDKKSKIYLYRIAQEALNNVVKHARASLVTIKLIRKGDLINLEISDNGKGFIFDPVCFAQRNGLQNMRERAQLLQGIFDLSSAPGAGTTLKATIPYITGNGKN